jgi:hypothetical protein
MVNSSQKAKNEHHAASQLNARTRIFEGSAMEKFRVVVWCESCRGDDEGCFGGSAEVIGAAFPSWEDAQKAGAHYCSDLPYQYRVEQGELY